jgi:hypothetical protein
MRIIMFAGFKGVKKPGYFTLKMAESDVPGKK